MDDILPVLLLIGDVFVFFVRYATRIFSVLANPAVIRFSYRHVGQRDHDLGHPDHVDPYLPLEDIVQDLYSADPTLTVVPDHAHHTAPTCQHELDHTY